MGSEMDYFNELITSGTVFWICAFLGTLLFCIQFIMNLFGFSDHMSSDCSGISSDIGHDSSEISTFKWLSMQTLTGFLMMFGWTAITCQNEFRLQIVPTFLIALVAGFSAALLIRLLFKFAKRLHSPGTVFTIEEAIGKEAYVYQRIPKGGMGKISMTLQGTTHELDAISYNSEELPSFARVKIIEKFDDKTVVVTPL